MAKNKIRVNPSILKWARETKHIKLEEIKEKFPYIETWEMGEDMPTYSQLVSLSEKYGRPTALFFFPKPPKEKDITASLRAINPLSIVELSPSIIKIFRNAQSFQYSLEEMLDKNIAKNSVNQILDIQEKNVKILAQNVRKKLNISIDIQYSWKKSDDALEEWRKAISNFGIYIFKDAFHDNSISGFCLHDESFPIIYLNNSLSKNRQIFTLFHEIAHLIRKESYLDIFEGADWENVKDDYNHIEYWCNSFAAHLLIPDDAILKENLNDINFETINKLSEKYKVSGYVIARKLFDLNKIDFLLYKNLTAHYKNNSNNEKKSSGGNFYNTMSTYLDNTYQELVFSNHLSGKINDKKLAEYLGVSSVRVALALEEKFLIGDIK